MPAPVITPSEQAQLRKPYLAPGDTISYTSQSDMRPPQPRSTVKRDGTGLLVPRSVLGPSEDFDATLKRMQPLAPAPEPPSDDVEADAHDDAPEGDSQAAAPAAAGPSDTPLPQDNMSLKLAAQERG